MRYLPSIGIEVHAELKTASKMFCDCRNDPDEKHPNRNVCPICLGHPGTLPVPNAAALAAMIRIGLAVGGEIVTPTKFDRKNYFYPDLPKGYQISQYDRPIVRGGMIRDIQLTRIHLEEDTGRLQHTPDKSVSLVDFNRAGIPLMELVTEPHITEPHVAREFGEELQLLLRYLGASDADMEKGQMRVEANVSIRPETQEKLGTKVEVKNINSFKAVEAAIHYEINRQAELLDAGEKIVQETRGWDDVKKVTKSQRTKEEAHDYRYLPEPDIPPIDLESFDIDALRRDVPELPWEKRVRFRTEYGLTETHAELLVRDRALAKFFEEAVSEIKADDKTKTVATLYNYLSSDLLGLLADQNSRIGDVALSPAHFADLVSLAADGTISSRMTKDILKTMLETGADPHEIINREGLEQVSDEGEIEKIANAVIADNPEVVEQYKSGKTTVLQFLIGKTMARMAGKGNPEALKRVLERLLAA